MTITEQIECGFCLNRHTRRFACDPVLAMLDGIRQRGEDLNKPPVEFGEPMFPGAQPGDALLAGITVMAGMIPMSAPPSADLPGGVTVTYPALVFAGTTLSGPTPRWIYPSNPDGLRDLVRLVGDMSDMAIRRVGKQ